MVAFDWGEGIKWSAYLDTLVDEIVMTATIPNKSYLSVGFGPTMRETDMIVWRWNDDETEVDNLWSTSYSRPASDGTDHLKTAIQDSDDGQFKIFTTRRAFDTGNARDFVIDPDAGEMVMCWAHKTRDGQFTEHRNRDVFAVNFSSPAAVVD